MLIDFHCHIYPKYDLTRLLDQAFRNFQTYQSKLSNRTASTQTEFVLVLTERLDCDAFGDLYSGKITLSDSYKIEHTPENCSLKITSKQHQSSLYLIAGQQINTIEKLELLAFGCATKIPAKISWQATFELIRAAGGIPIINWAPGKWWFKRGQLIRAILEQDSGLLLCDTALRPFGYPLPILMRYAKKLGIKTYFGSDPLPLEGEELRICSYLSNIEAGFKSERPKQELQELLLASETKIEPVGKRLSPLALATLLFRYYRSGKN